MPTPAPAQKQLRIAIEARYIDTRLSGIGRYVLNALRGWVGSDNGGHTIYVLTHDPADLTARLGGSVAPLQLIHVPGSPRKLSNQWKLPKLFRKLKIDVYHSADAFAPLITKTRTVITIHDLIPLVCTAEQSPALKTKYSSLWRFWLKRQCAAASCILTDSQHSQLDIIRELNVAPERVKVIYPGVEVSRPLDEVCRHELLKQAGVTMPFVLYVGRRDPYKNVEGLIAVFARVAPTRPDLRLVIAGDRDARFTGPESRADRLNIRDRVIFAGQVSDETLTAFYQSASALVNLSTYEGFGLPVLEAMGMGCPVLSSDKASLPEVCGDAAILVDPINETRCADGLTKILTGGPEIQTLIERGHTNVKRFDPTRQAALLLNAYENLSVG